MPQILIFILTFGILGVRWSLRRVLPLKGGTVENAALLGFFAFIVSGFIVEPELLDLQAFVILAAFAMMLTFGHLAGAAAVGRWTGAAELGEIAFSSHVVRVTVLAIFLGGIASTVWDIVRAPQPIWVLFAQAWLTNGVDVRGAGLIVENFSRARTGLDAVLSGIRSQLTGFAMLGAGVLMRVRGSWGYLALGAQMALLLVTAGGARSPLLISAATIVLLWLRRRPEKAIPWVRLGTLTLAMVLLLDFAMEGRTGGESAGLGERIQRTVRNDFAYGAAGYDFGIHSEPPDASRSVRYSLQLLGGPVPRFLWPSKPIKDPNWEMTEEYSGRDLTATGSITLLTPLAEMLFYWGPVFGLVVPFLYGFVTSALQGIYVRSESYQVLLAHLVVWAALGMRHTFWNVALATVVESFVFLVALVMVGATRKMRRHPSPA